MTTEYIAKTWDESMHEITKAIAEENAATTHAARQEARERREFWSNEATNMWAAARKYGVRLPEMANVDPA